MYHSLECTITLILCSKLSNTQKGTLLAFIGVMIVTPDSLIIRLVSIDTWNLLFYRSLFPGTALLIGYFILHLVMRSVYRYRN